jgi:hypothetical protein
MEQPSTSQTGAEISDRSQSIVIPSLSRYAREAIGPEPDPLPREQVPTDDTALCAEAIQPESAGPTQPPPSPIRPGLAPGPLRGEDGERIPFWKRVAMYRPETALTTPPAAAVEAVAERMAGLEQRLSARDEELARRLDRFEENITRLWEIEEQMSLNELREKLAFIQANQEEIADGLHALSRNATFLTAALVLLAAGAALAVAALL